jgi:RNA polymerase sigma-70 factor (ECF subfamily)
MAGCIDKLPDAHREMLRLRYSDGLAIEAVASQVDRSVEAVYRALSRIRQAIHQCVTQTLAKEGAS